MQTTAPVGQSGNARDYFTVKYLPGNLSAGMRDQDPTLLQTKLRQPHIPRDLVERARLVESLERGVPNLMGKIG